MSFLYGSNSGSAQPDNTPGETTEAKSVTGSFSVPIVKGAGEVRVELFIAAAIALDLKGDGRNADPAPNPLNSRAWFTMNFETGVGALQVNPSCAVGGGCSSALPLGAGNSFAAATAGNTVSIDASLKNSIHTSGPSIDFHLEFTARPTGVSFSGWRNAFPSMEVTRGSHYAVFPEKGFFRLWDFTPRESVGGGL
jgi:hypothetical protein